MSVELVVSLNDVLVSLAARYTSCWSLVEGGPEPFVDLLSTRTKHSRAGARFEYNGDR